MVERPIVLALQELGTREGAVYGANNAAGWFDGFWDFFVRERANIARSASWWVSGTEWFVLFWERQTDEGGVEPRLDIFVENKDRRPGVVAPWPVSTIHLDGGSAVAPAAVVVPRHVATATADALATSGLHVEVGYWGTHIHRADGAELEVADLERLLHAALGLLLES